MKLKHVFLPMLLILALTACEDRYENLSSQLPSAAQSSQGMSEQLAYEAIIERANQYYLQLTGGTRSEAPDVKEVLPLNGSSTRSDSSPSYVLVNYEENSGFVIIGTNNVSEDMLAISDEGNLNLADTVFNKGLAEFIRAANTPSPTAIVAPPIERDTSVTVRPPIIVNVTVAPLLHANVRMWGQETPFNAYTPKVEKDGKSKNAPVGCAPLASAMIMSYYEWPETHNGRSYDWKEIKSSMGTDNLYRLLKELGDASNYQVTYGYDGTSASPSKCYTAFNNYGYTINHNEITLDQMDLSFYDTVKGRLPLLMFGWGSYQGKRVGHSWVIDGLLHLPKYNAFEQIRDEDKYYFHCVWGWYGKDNGYFAYDKLKGIGGIRDKECYDDYMYPGHSDVSNNLIFDESYGIFSIKPNK